MATINNRYDILEEEDITEELMLFKVKDIDNNKIQYLYVIENCIWNESIKEALVNEFDYLKSFNFQGIINVEDIIFVENKDGIKFNNVKIGYSAEYIEDYEKLNSVINNLSFRARMDIFGQVCTIINTLYIQGYKLPSLTANDIFIKQDKEENKGQIKIRDLVTFELIKTLSDGESTKIIKKNNDLNLTILGDVFYNIFEREINSDGLRSEEIKSVYSKLITKKGAQVFDNISDCIKYLNNIFRGYIEEFNYEAVNRICNGTQIIGREYEVNKIIEEIESVYSKNEKNKVIFLQGEYGCGKSYILDHIKYKVNNKYNDINLLDISDVYRDTWADKIKILIEKVCPEDTFEKYNDYLNEFIKGIFEFKNIDILCDREFIVLNRIIKLFLEIADSTPIILIFDNLDLSVKRTEMCIKYIMNMLRRADNIVLIATMSNNNLENIFSKSELNNISIYNLEYLSEYETAKLISSSLQTNELLYEFSNNMYRETLGNPKFIKFMINKLYKDNKLYVDKKTGVWICDGYISGIEIPADLEESLYKQLAAVTIEELEILQDISIFNNPLKSEFFEGNILLDRNIQFKKLKDLKLIVEKFDDNGLLIDYRNHLLKKVVYKSLNEQNRISKHKDAIKLLESNFVDIKEILEELICQHEALNDYDKCSELCKKYATSMFKDSKEKAIVFYKKALKYLANNEKESLMLYFQIGKAYEYLGKNENAYEQYMHIREYSRDSNNLELAEVLIRMANIAIKQYGIPHAENLMYEAKERLGVDRENIWYRYVVAKILYEKSEIDNSLKEVNEIFDVINSKEKELYALALSLKGVLKIEKTQYKEAKKLIYEAKTIFNNIGNIKGKIICDIDLGALKVRDEKNLNEALNIYKNISEIIKIHDIQEDSIHCNINLAKIYMLNEEFEEAKEISLSLLDNFKNNNYIFYKSIVYLNLCYYYTRVEELDLAYEYLKMGLNIMNRIKSYSRYDIYSIYCVVQYYAKINRFDEAIKILEVKEKDLILYDNSINRMVLSKYYYYCIKNTKNITEIKTILLKLRRPLSKIRDEKFKLSISYDIIIHLSEIGFKDVARKVFQGCYKSYDDNYIKVKNAYLKMLFNIGNKNELIREVLDIVDTINDKSFVSKVYYLLGNIKNFKNDYIEAIHCYYNAMSYIAINSEMLHNEEKLFYFNKTDFIAAYNNICEILVKEYNIGARKSNFYEMSSIEQLDELIEKAKLENLMEDEALVNVLKSNHKYNNNIDFNVYDIFGEFTNNIIDNIESIIKVILKETLSDKAVLFINDSKEKYKKIYGLNDDSGEKIKELLLQVKYDSDIVIIRESLKSDPLINSCKILPSGIKSAMVMNIAMPNEDGIGEKVNGTLVIMSKSALNNITNKVKNNLRKLIPFIDFLMAQHRLKEVSTLDKLTGVYNRKYLDDIYPAFINRAREKGTVFSAVIFDIDNFKGVNDNFGHQVGDEVLIKVANLVKDKTTSRDVFARYGGEEFVILMAGINANEALERANNIRKIVDEAKALGDRRELTISMGIAEYPRDSNSANGLIKKADQALYVAKETGRNRCVVWDNEFSKGNSVNDKLAGIISGNSTKDYRKISLMIDVVSLIKQNISFESKVEKILSIVMEASEAEQASLMIVENNEIKNIYSKKQFVDNWINEKSLNYNIIKDCVSKKEGAFLVDWQYSSRLEGNELLPDWKSLCVTPIINDGEVKGCMYLSVSINKKEFSFDEYNYITTICEMATAMF